MEQHHPIGSSSPAQDKVMSTFKSFQNNVVLYKNLQKKLQEKPLFLTRSLRYMDHLRQNSLDQDSTSLPHNEGEGEMVTYNFAGLQKETFMDWRCPFCLIDCKQWSPQLKTHLEVCHPRFSFTFNQAIRKITVSPNEGYDGSLELINKSTSSPPTQQWQSPMSLRVSSGKRKLALQQNYRECDVTWLNHRKPKIYFNHQLDPILPGQEFYTTTGGEFIKEYLRMLAENLNEFTDINMEEKKIMFLWKKFIYTYPKQLHRQHLYIMIKDFIEKFKTTILNQDIQMNALLHLTLLCELKIINCDELSSLIDLLFSD